MHLILVSDIYGVDSHLNQLANHFNYDQLTLIDPYGGQPRAFARGADAYEAFLRECGHQHYTELVARALRDNASSTLLVGFSSGASAAWRAMLDHRDPDTVQLWCFYPSQLDQHYRQRPACQTRLILPCHEPHFDVGAIAGRLDVSPALDWEQTNLEHGFFNPNGQQHDADATRHYTEALLSA